VHQVGYTSFEDNESELARWIVTFIDRSLFLLHGSILDIFETLHTEIDLHIKQMSWAALDMACQLVVDVARYNKQERVETMPILCCYYNIQAALKCLQKRKKFCINRETCRNIEFLLHSESMYARKWLF